MPSGIRIQDLAEGTGVEAGRGKVLTVHIRMMLRKGDIVFDSERKGPPIRIDLRRRDHPPGLQKGIEGMRVGGKRRLRISPHLAYGDEGIPAQGIPPRAVLICDVELMEVRDSGDVRPEDHPPGRQILIHHPGDPESGDPAWQFALHDDGRVGASLRYPIPGQSWRHAIRKEVEGPPVEPATVKALFTESMTMRRRHPFACLSSRQVGSQGGYSLIRDRRGRPCLGMGVHERGQLVRDFYLVTTSRVWRKSRVWALVREILGDRLEARFGSKGEGCRLP